MKDKIKIDIDKVHELTLALKKVIMNEPVLEATIAIDRFILFSRKKEFWTAEEPQGSNEIIYK